MVADVDAQRKSASAMTQFAKVIGAVQLQVMQGFYNKSIVCATLQVDSLHELQGQKVGKEQNTRPKQMSNVEHGRFAENYPCSCELQGDQAWFLCMLY